MDFFEQGKKKGTAMIKEKRQRGVKIRRRLGKKSAHKKKGGPAVGWAGFSCLSLSLSLLYKGMLAHKG